MKDTPTRSLILYLGLETCWPGQNLSGKRFIGYRKIYQRLASRATSRI